jgi:SAM-dependent methyltransferase
MLRRAARIAWNQITQNRRLLRARQSALLSSRPDAEVLEIGSGNTRGGKYFQSARDLAPVGMPFTMTDVDNRDGHQVLDITSVGVEWGTYDIVLCCNVLEHVFDLGAAIQGLARLTADGGLVLASTPFAYPLHDEPGDYWRPTEHALRELFGRHFETVEISHAGVRQLPFQLFVIAAGPKRQ